jgi:hypothetical protein
MNAELHHLDHELSQLVSLHLERRSPRYPAYPECVRRAIVVAYAAHYRVLLEFFHDGRSRAAVRDGDCPTPADLKFSEVAAGQTAPTWSPAAVRRLCDADKLVGHLSQQRGEREAEWGQDSDWELMRPLVARLFREVQDARNRLPRTAALLDPLGVSGDPAERGRQAITEDYLGQLTRRMKEHGISQNALAREMGINPSQASRWFTSNTARRVMPELSTIQRIEKALESIITRTAA